jgi:hypothetical protein
MALKLSIPTQFGPVAEEAYARITNFYGTKDQIQVQVAIYYDESSRHANRSAVADTNHYIAIADLPKGMDIIPAIYAVLKTMGEYQNAVDA